MKISYKWLKEYIDVPPDRIGTILTNTGLEVSAVERKGMHPETKQQLIVGKVIRKWQHPNADRLSLTEVDTGNGETVQVVCGAPNVAEGQHIVFAPVGACLHHINGSTMKIKKIRIRGEESSGMICAEDEIGLGNCHDGIMVLDADAKTGAPASDYISTDEDIVFEIDLTPNRIDGASHIGAARDIRAFLTSESGHLPALSIPPVNSFKPESNDLDIDVKVEAKEACLRYSAVSITGVKVESSPSWLQQNLQSIGLKPINNVVDITNFVLYETGHPLHAFDASKIAGNKVIVKKLADKTPFVTLDEVQRSLSADDLMICNEREGMCIAGVFGGLYSSVGEQTTSVFLESACFDPAHIRKTARRHTLSTEASFRFERGVDPNNTIYALKRAALLIKKICGGKIASDIKDVYPEPAENKIIDLSLEYCDRLVGEQFDRQKMKIILRALDIDILSESEDAFSLSIPTYRVDVTRPADVVEEILRIHGYNNISTPSQLRISLNDRMKNKDHDQQELISSMLCSSGFTEIMTNSLDSESFYEESGLYKDNRQVSILNPLSSELNVMRRTLLAGGLETIRYNINRQMNDLNIFEFGSVYAQHSKEAKETDAVRTFEEEKRLALFMCGARRDENWNTTKEQCNFFNLKGMTEKIFRCFQFDQPGYNEISSEEFSYGLICSFKGKTLARLGELNKKICDIRDVDIPVFYAEIYWNHLNLFGQKKISYKEMSKFPLVRRDLALLVEEKTSFEQLKKAAFRSVPELLKSCGLFDVYKGKGIPEGQKSYALSFVFSDSSATLTDEKVDALMEQLRTIFKKDFGASVR